MKQSITQQQDLRALPKVVLPARTAVTASRWSCPSLPKEVWDVVHTVGRWPDLAIVPDRSGLCLSLRGVTLGHLSWDRRVDLQFGPEVRARLADEELARRDPDMGDSDGIGLVLRTEADVDHAVWLLKLAYCSVDLRLDSTAAETEQ
jgi:hypothetical protein